MMKLVRLRKAAWEVLLLCDARGRCQLEEFFRGLERKYDVHAARILYWLEQEFPLHGPPTTDRATPQCKHLRDGIYELKAGRLRVLWFYGSDDRVVVCTEGVFKTRRKTDSKAIDRAVGTKERYERARQAGTLEIVPRA